MIELALPEIEQSVNCMVAARQAEIASAVVRQMQTISCSYARILGELEELDEAICDNRWSMYEWLDCIAPLQIFTPKFLALSATGKSVQDKFVAWQITQAVLIIKHNDRIRQIRQMQGCGQCHLCNTRGASRRHNCYVAGAQCVGTVCNA